MECLRGDCRTIDIVSLFDYLNGNDRHYIIENTLKACRFDRWYNYEAYYCE